MVVFAPYMLLLAYTAHSYVQFPSELSGGLPKILLWVPAGISVILPITYGILVFGFREHLKPKSTLGVGILMDAAFFGLAFVIYLAGLP